MIRAALISGFATLALPAHANEFLSLAMDAGAGVHAFGTATSAGDAQTEAMGACSKLAKGCEIVVTRSGVCVSLADDYSNGGFGVYTAGTAEVAEREALPHCASYGNPNCQTVETVCAK